MVDNQSHICISSFLGSYSLTQPHTTVRGRFGECAFCAFGRFAETVAAQKAVLLPPGPLASRAFCKTAALPEFHLMDRCTG